MSSEFREHDDATRRSRCKSEFNTGRIGKAPRLHDADDTSRYHDAVQAYS
jgi:hypothetical protein